MAFFIERGRFLKASQMLLNNFAVTVLDRFAIAPSERIPIAERQSGVIPYTLVDGSPIFLLITTRRTGRWIFPKGRIKDSFEPWESARKEAFEEAGIEGEIETLPVGSYRTWKTRGVRRVAIEIDMFPFKVERQFDNWRETGERHRHWVTLREARRLIRENRLVDLVGIVADRVREQVRPHQPDSDDIIA